MTDVVTLAYMMFLTGFLYGAIPMTDIINKNKQTNSKA
jgi:hypothetical protein